MHLARPIEHYRFTPHARFEMRRRCIDENAVRAVLAAPEQRHPVRRGRDVLQSRVEFAGMTYLLRVFVDVDLTLAEVVTVYRTSNIRKYWRASP